MAVAGIALCAKAFKEAVLNVCAMLALTNYTPNRKTLSFTSYRGKMFSLIFRRAMAAEFSRLHHLLQVNSPNRVHNLKHTVSLLFLPWLLS